MLAHRASTILGDIPQDWKAKPLKRLLSEQFSGDWGAEEGEQAVNVIRSTNFTSSGAIEFSDVATRYFPQSKAESFALKMGDLLVERSGGGPDQPVGRIGFISEDLSGKTVSNFVQVLRPDPDKVDSDYLGWVLFELQRSGIVERVQQQSTQMRNLQYRDYLRLLLPWPEPDEQRRIAAALNLADDAITKARAELEATRELKQSIEYSLLDRRIDKYGRKKKKTKIGSLPFNWNVEPLKQLAEIDSGITLNQDRLPKKSPCRYLTVAHVQRGRIVYDDSRFLELDPEERENRILLEEDILVVEGHANSMEIGRAAIVERVVEPMTYQNHLFRVRPNYNRMLPKFLCYVLNSERVQKHWNAVCNTSSGLNTINRRNLRNLLIQKPKINEQGEIIEILETAEISAGASKRKLDTLVELKHSLLQNLLTGKIRLPEGVADV